MPFKSRNVAAEAATHKDFLLFQYCHDRLRGTASGTTHKDRLRFIYGASGAMSGTNSAMRVCGSLLQP
jgi:hypothetical protein